MRNGDGWELAKLGATFIGSCHHCEELHDLIQLAARRWGISCDVTRHDAAEKASAAELAEVGQLLQGRHPQIYRWLYSRTSAGTTAPSESLTTSP